jgi:hypothetical protein
MITPFIEPALVREVENSALTFKREGADPGALSDYLSFG